MLITPSDCTRAKATDTGVAPALVTAQARPTGARCFLADRLHWLDLISFFNHEAKFASMPFNQGRSSSSLLSKFLSRSSAESIPKRVAAISICDSPAKITCGAPMARKEPAEPEFV